jgi:hypothetical protein
MEGHAGILATVLTADKLAGPALVQLNNLLVALVGGCTLTLAILEEAVAERVQALTGTCLRLRVAALPAARLIQAAGARNQVKVPIKPLAAATTAMEVLKGRIVN